MLLNHDIALGISDEVDMFGLKGSKKRKGKKLDEDYVPVLKPLSVMEVPKVVTAMRESLNRKVVVKLLTRIKVSRRNTLETTLSKHPS